MIILDLNNCYTFFSIKLFNLQYTNIQGTYKIKKKNSLSDYNICTEPHKLFQELVFKITKNTKQMIKTLI